MNGGAIIAALSVYGALKGEVPKTLFSTAIGWWIVGLVCAAIAVLLISLAEREFQATLGAAISREATVRFDVDLDEPRRRSARVGNWLRYASIVAWLLSIGIFSWGAYSVIPTALVGSA